MAQQAYNHVYDYTYAPGTAPEMPARPKTQPQTKTQPQLRKVKKTKAQVMAQRRRRVRLFLLKSAVVLSLFGAMIGVAVASEIRKDEAAEALAAMKTDYQSSIQLNNELKDKLNAFMSKLDIDKIATQQLGLVKVGNDDKYYLGQQSDDASKTDKVYEETTASSTAVQEDNTAADE